MKPELVSAYLTTLKKKTGLTYEAIASKSQRSESTVKNLCLGNVDDPRLDTVAPIVYALGGSIDEMLNPDERDEMKEVSVIALKESYEHQHSLMKEAYETQVNNVRSHYEQHCQDIKENAEVRLSDRDKIISALEGHIKGLKETESREIKRLKISNHIKTGIITLFVLGIAALLILEHIFPHKGWITF